MTEAVILAGGEGTRLRPLTLDTPKQMLPILGRPMIVEVVERLASHGVRRVVLSLGYRPDAFVDAFPTGRIGTVELAYAVEPEPLDTAGAIGFAARSCGIDETFLVVNGDVLTDLDIGALLGAHRASGALATIHLVSVDTPSAFGVVVTDPSGEVVAFIEKPPPDEVPSDLINAGTYVLEPKILGSIPPGRRVSIERETFPGLVAERALFGFAAPAYWIDTGTPSSYLQAQVDLLGSASHLGPSCTVAPDAVFDSAVLGTGVAVGAGTVIRRSVLLDGVRCGPGVVIEDSIVGAGAVLRDGCRLRGFSVIAGRAEVLEGAVLDGVRLERDDSERSQ